MIRAFLTSIAVSYRANRGSECRLFDYVAVDPDRKVFKVSVYQYLHGTTPLFKYIPLSFCAFCACLL